LMTALIYFEGISGLIMHTAYHTKENEEQTFMKTITR